MEKGFYEDFYENGTNSFGFMENINNSFYQEELEIINLEKYLHGYCDEFALMLNSVYKYPIEVIFFCGKIIHAYCKVDKYFIDVRGITDNEELFFSEFEEELSRETYRASYKTAKECFNDLRDQCGINYRILQREELKLLSEDKFLSNYYKL